MEYDEPDFHRAIPSELLAPQDEEFQDDAQVSCSCHEDWSAWNFIPAVIFHGGSARSRGAAQFLIS
jgi:hypothetical protein